MKKLLSVFTFGLLFLTTPSFAQAPLQTAQEVTKEFIQGINNLEKEGLSGVWFKSVSPFATDQTLQAFYLIKKIPARINPASSLFLLRLDHSRRGLEQLLNDGVPIILGTIPFEAGVEAAAMGQSYRLISDGLKVAHDAKHTNGILVRLSASRYTVAHEHQHWLDFESANYIKKFSQFLQPYSAAGYFTQDQINSLWRIVWEIRAYSVQAKTIRQDEASRLPCLNRSGAVLAPSAPNWKSEYDFEAVDPIGAFEQNYTPALYGAIDKISKNSAAFAQFKSSLSQFDFSSDPSNPITFKRYLH